MSIVVVELCSVIVYNLNEGVKMVWRLTMNGIICGVVLRLGERHLIIYGERHLIIYMEFCRQSCQADNLSRL